ncbi:hypothetical protein LBMAG20_14040 [Methylocystaceae bacterium]|nr:hypothetical protein LBMAG20_14040 [Methylocystaceae bacterium]
MSSQSDYVALDRKISRLIDRNQLLSMLPSQRSLLTLMLSDLLEQRKSITLIKSEDIINQFEIVTGKSPIINIEPNKED